MKDRSVVLNIRLELKTKESTDFFVKYSITYFSPKNKAVYIKPALVQYSTICLITKSTNIPAWENRKNDLPTIPHFNIKIIYRYRVGWNRTNTGYTNRFTVYRFNHSATTLQPLKRIELFAMGNEPTLRPLKAAKKT